MWTTNSYPCTQLVDSEQTLFKPTMNNYRSNHETRLKENLKNYYHTDIEIYKPHLQCLQPIQYWKRQPNACQPDN